MNHGVVVALVLCIGGHDFPDVRNLENSHEVVHNPGNTFVEVVSCEIVEYLTQEWIRLRYETGCFFATEIFRGIVVQTGCKHAVSNRLGIDICKIFFLQILYEHKFECLVLCLQIVVLECVFLIVHRRLDDIGQQTCFASHQLCQTGSRGDALDGRCPQVLNHAGELLFGFSNSHNLATFRLCNPYTIHKLAIFVEMKVQIICEDNIIECLLIAVELLFMAVLAASVEVVVVHIFCLHKEHRQMVFLPLNDIVRRTTFDMCRFVSYHHLWEQTLQQVFQGRTIRVLASNTRLVLLVQFVDVSF